MKIVEHNKEGDVDIIKVLERRIFLDLSEKFKEQVIQVIEGGAKNLVFDLSNVKIMNSSGFGVLILARSKITDKGGKMAVCGLLPLMQEIFDRMQFSTFFEVKKSLEEAIAEVRN